MQSGAGSTMLKFGLLLVLANLCLKLLIGIGLWKMAMEFKNSNERIKESVKYNEENIEEGDPEILRGKANQREINNEYENENDDPNN